MQRIFLVFGMSHQPEVFILSHNNLEILRIRGTEWVVKEIPRNLLQLVYSIQDKPELKYKYSFTISDNFTKE